MKIIRDFKVTSDQEKLRTRYKYMHENPRECGPLFIMDAPVANLPPWEERLADPMKMLACELAALQSHQEIGDDAPMAVRVQFGTAQIAAAFGCDMFIPPNSLPCAGNHILHNIEDVYDMKKPGIEAGWFAKLWEWTRLWRKSMPEDVHFLNPDIQSAFNSAHLIRGNDAFTDFFDNPEALERLMELVTDYMIDIIAEQERVAPPVEKGYFFDWGAYWKGHARISNCSIHMVGPELYRKHILKHDRRFFETVDGGRVHYCGSYPEVIYDFAGIPGVFGMDLDHEYHDFFTIVDQMPEHLALIANLSHNSKEISRFLSGDWPLKRNFIARVYVPSVEEGKILLDKLHLAAG